jgi:hypothetical protein
MPRMQMARGRVRRPSDAPQGEKLEQLEDMSRQLRRSRVRDQQGGFGSQPTQDW